MDTVKEKRKKKPESNKYWQGCAEITTLMNYWWECKMVQVLWETVCQIPQKLKTELPYD